MRVAPGCGESQHGYSRFGGLGHRFVETFGVSADLEKIDPLRSLAISANGRLDQFLAYQGETGEMLLREIDSGVKACMDTRDD